MMNRFSVVLQNAFDALAPPAPLHEDFVYHWKRLMKHYLDVAATNKVAIELTNIPAHLEQLEKILLKEDAETSPEEATAPCLEYLMKHNLLDLLATLAISDDPPGMRQYVLRFITQILTHLQASILAHSAIFPPLQRLIEMCNGLCPTPSEFEEVKFLFSLSAQLRKHPNLVYVYMLQGENPERRLSVSSTTSNQSCSSQRTAAPNNPLFRPLDTPLPDAEPKLIPVEATQTSPVSAASTEMSQQAVEQINSLPKFPLINSLITYINSADSNVRVKACQAIMLLTSVPDDKFAQIVAHQSPLCESLALKLTAQYLEIPPETDPNHIDDMHATWGLDTPIPLEVEESCEGCRQAATFLGWLDFCDQVAVEGRPVIGTSLASCIRELFLDQEFEPELLPNSLVLALLTKCFKVITSAPLTKEMSEWLVGESRSPELPGVVTCRTRQALLDICSHSEPAVSLEALRLFEVLLEKNIEHIIHCLVLTYVEGRGYYDNTLSPSHIESWSDEEDERERHRESPDTDGSGGVSRTMAPSHIDKIINGFLNIVPSCLRSAPSAEAGGYHQYVSESQRQYSLVLAACSRFSWPVEAVSDDNLSSDSRPEADTRQFYEGPFLRMIFNRIRDLPNQAYEVNLQLTAVISRLALLPHPYLHEYLLNTSVPRRPDADSLLAALSDTAALLFTQVTALPDYKGLLQETRHRLLGQSSDKREEYCSQLESVVVLEEVCKELAAIAFVKFHHAT
ncbi:FHF complex subunit HOOK interacting protein 2A-like [Macrosteles quadrilineatus]|uniref:FHF complex subunit HOOK interacting protein 2A-like n=1 Tax=Macrosteles quadrilineatus TaxID=74068 RepID=UPI0023E19948|nr:FHF complex subunit HOOK interacting protein 2A-like [Macrosteles quadrilineatus]